MRYGLGDGSDLGRVSNQQLFLASGPTDSSGAVALPSNVYGQTAAQTTCTKGQTAG